MIVKIIYFAKLNLFTAFYLPRHSNLISLSADLSLESKMGTVNYGWTNLVSILQTAVIELWVVIY